MIIFRYFAKEVAITLVALTCILLLIFLSNQFVQYLTRVAAGQIPASILLQLIALEAPSLLGLLLPLGFFIAVLIAYGRLYADYEITALSACGLSQRQLFAMTLIMASVVAGVVAILVLWANPIISKQRDYLLTSGGAVSLIQMTMPGKFHAIAGGTKVFYVAEKSRDSTQASDVFFIEQTERNVRSGEKAWDVLSAHEGQVTQDPQTGESFLILSDGYQYQGTPGQAEYQVIDFAEYHIRLPRSEPRVRREQQAMPTKALWPLNNADPKKVAELQWRLSAPLMTLVLATLVVPLSRSNPRNGKFARLLPAILIYILYANTIFVSRDWIANEQIPSWLGMWWLHGSILLLAGCLAVWPMIKSKWLS